MPIPTWPAGFPAPLREDYGYTQPELGLRSEFALGSRVRPLYADGPDEVRVSVILSPAQWAYFQGWLRHVLKNGAAWFAMPIIAAGLREDREVQMLGPLSYQLIGLRSVRVSMPVRTRIGTTMDAATWEAFSAFPDPVTAFTDLQALEDFVNSASGPPAFALSFADDGDGLLFSDSGSTLDFAS